MIEVYETNISRQRDARIIVGLFRLNFPQLRVNFDLDDVDNIFRVESNKNSIDLRIIEQYIKELGFVIKVLDQ